jgi:alkanesulfonate monooxygenase SsuD/methylene tetrahydromethanopterin reductase-like flavin-dependent oxidoreductase (luciferase family)
LAARLGLPYAFAHHFAGAGGNTGAALDLYRSQFRPSDVLAEPYPMIGVSALAADTEERARYEARAGALSMLLLRSGRLQEIPSPEQAAAYPYSPAELDLLRAMGRTEVVGSAEQVAAGLDELAQRYGVREMIISTRAYSLSAKLASMDLIAQAYSRVGAAG